MVLMVEPDGANRIGIDLIDRIEMAREHAGKMRVGLRSGSRFACEQEIESMDIGGFGKRQREIGKEKILLRRRGGIQRSRCEGTRLRMIGIGPYIVNLA